MRIISALGLEHKKNNNDNGEEEEEENDDNEKKADGGYNNHYYYYYNFLVSFSFLFISSFPLLISFAMSVHFLILNGDCGFVLFSLWSPLGTGKWLCEENICLPWCLQVRGVD